MLAFNLEFNIRKSQSELMSFVKLILTKLCIETRIKTFMIDRGEIQI
jgi:hypothetical protein